MYAATDKSNEEHISRTAVGSVVQEKSNDTCNSGFVDCRPKITDTRPKRETGNSNLTQPIQKKSNKRQYHVRDDPCGSDQHHPHSPVTQLVEINRHRLCPAKTENKEHYRAHGVEVFDRIEA